MKSDVANRFNRWFIAGSCCLLMASWSPGANAAEGKEGDTKQDSSKSSTTDNSNAQGEKRAWIGIQFRQRDDQSGQSEQNGSKEGQKGLEISAVYPNGPAARGGLKEGDVIQNVNGKAVTSPQEVTETIRHLKPGTTAKIGVRREGAEKTLTVTLGDAAEFNPSHGQRAQGDQQQYGGPQRTFAQGQNGQYGGNQYGPNGQGGGWNQGFGNPYDGVPEHAMMLEYNRRNSEQHERMESQIEELLKEIRALRKEIQELKAK